MSRSWSFALPGIKPAPFQATSRSNNPVPNATESDYVTQVEPEPGLTYAATVTDAQFAVLEDELGKGPSAHSFKDDRWTLVRVQAVIRRRL